MDYITNIFFISLFCAGLNKAIQPGMILHSSFVWLSKFFYGSLKFIWPPIGGCVYCFASFWGSIVYWCLEMWVWNFEVDVSTWVMWPITCICCVYTNGLFYQLLKRIEDINEKANLG